MILSGRLCSLSSRVAVSGGLLRTISYNLLISCVACWNSVLFVISSGILSVGLLNSRIAKVYNRCKVFFGVLYQI